MKTQNSITVSSTKVILNICLFIAVYILLIILGALLLWGTAHAAFFIISLIFSIRLSTTSFILLMAGVGILGFGVMFGLYLIKFLFTRIKNENPERIEINQIKLS